ncbi:MAG: cache domain-containing protein [Candidatus Roizmanbacteria bacterium]|nr:cache domain-containing protein [Candidatus Roizmanbacteria bacterium]
MLDNSYVDGIKATTGMSISIYGDKILSSTTEDIGDGTTRLVGIKETDNGVLENVWDKGIIFAQSSRLGEHEYLSGYVPLKDGSGTSIGALQISEPQTTVIQTAGQAVQLTFALVIAIMVTLSLPIYFICKRLVAECE